MASQNRKGKGAGSKKKPAGAIAFHAESTDGEKHVVGIGNLRVMLFNDDSSWFAQGLEVDYSAQGESLEDVQQRFQEGLRATVDLHLRMDGSILGVLQAAPPEVWTEFYSQKPATYQFSQISFHLPFAGIQYFRSSKAA